MNNDKKILFFDIDGTLLTPYPFRIPDSARQALKVAQANGHLLFINSGRTRIMIPSYIEELGFDGYVCGCGSQIYMKDELLFSSSIPLELCHEVMKQIRECKYTAFFERPDKIVYDSSYGLVHPAVEHLKKETVMEDFASFDKKEADNFVFYKFLVDAVPESDVERFTHFCKEHFRIFDYKNGTMEITQKECTKATGIRFLLEHLNIPLKNSFAFGDGPNDLPMLKFAGNSIAMGNSDPEILPYCTYQTTHINDNGIKNALEYFGLI